MERIPNILSISRVPIGIAILGFAIFHLWALALVLVVVGILTDILDGELARRFGWVSSEGADKWEPLCDLILSVGAVGGLITGGAWAWWIGLVLIMAWGTIHYIENHTADKPHLHKLTRHTYYCGPFLYIGTMLVACATYIALAIPDKPLLRAICIGVLVFGANLCRQLKATRISTWLAGPPPTH